MLFRSGEDTVPYERFITPTDLNSRRVPALRRPFQADSYPDLTPAQRPEVAPPTQLRTTTGDPVQRNLASRPVIRGGWSIAGGEGFSSTAAPDGGPASVRQSPAPSRRWSPAPRGPVGAPRAWTSGVSAAVAAPAAPASPAVSSAGTWRAAVMSGTAKIGRAHV